ncbi:hypothetical protein ACNOYE_18915 [Nannocystaceae bacterium ST9]
MKPRLDKQLEKHGAIEQALSAAGRGPLLEQLGLNGEITIEGRRCSTSLCRTASGLFLLGLPGGVASDAAPVILDLLAPERTLRYRESVLGDRLDVDAWTLGIPRGRSERVRDVIAFARITRHFGTRAPVVAEPPANAPQAWSGPLVESLDARERHWLRHWLALDEQLFAWLDSDDRHRFVSRVGGELDSPITLVVSDRRQALVAISPLGDVWIHELPDERLVIQSQIGRDRVRVAGHELRTTLTNEGAFAAVAELPGLQGLDRRRGHALALWRWTRRSLVGPLEGEPRARVAAALGLLGDDPLALLARHLIVEPTSDELPEPVFAALRRFSDTGERAVAEQAERGRELLDWSQAWQIGPELGELLVEHLCELGEAGQRVALALHEHVRPALQVQVGDDLEAAAVLDFVLVEHLLALGEGERARALLERRRATLPSEDLQDLLPASAERGGQRIRIELHELLAAAHRQAGREADELAALAELARLQPLVRERVAALVERLPPIDPARPPAPLSIDARARRVLALLDEHAFTSTSNHASYGKIAALAERERELLRHPAARVDGVLGRLQGALAKVAVPDCSVLKSYCARANLAREQALAAAVGDAAVLLGIGAIEVFVSRGDKSIGMRAYEASTPFMLIGGDHLDRESDAFLGPEALRHAIAAELAHLRFAHSRVTGDEVWAGTLDLGLTGLGVLLAAAPLLKHFQAPAKHLLDKLGAPALARWRKKLSDEQGSRALGSENSELIAAHRVMQLTADRAGLLACGDPRAAIEAIFHVHPSHLSQWPLVVRRGLRDSLIRETRSDDDRDRARLEDLAVRVAALLSFYLSDDFPRLHTAAWPS